MLLVSKQIILVGGGASIKEGVSLGLKEKLDGKFIIAINYAYKHFPHTLCLFGDFNFYVPLEAKKDKPPKHPDIYEELRKEPLLIYDNDKNDLKEWQLPNTLFIKTGEEYNIEPLKKGFYKHFLTGICALSLAQYLLNYNGEIFLLGFDYGSIEKKSKETHYYTKEEINHRGQGLVSHYNSSAHSPGKYFRYFKEPKIKIWNVSAISKIDNFEKIDYNTMFKLLSDIIYEQEKLRKEVISVMG